MLETTGVPGRELFADCSFVLVCSSWVDDVAFCRSGGVHVRSLPACLFNETRFSADIASLVVCDAYDTCPLVCVKSARMALIDWRPTTVGRR